MEIFIEKAKTATANYLIMWVRWNCVTLDLWNLFLFPFPQLWHLLPVMSTDPPQQKWARVYFTWLYSPDWCAIWNCVFFIFMWEREKISEICETIHKIIQIILSVRCHKPYHTPACILFCSPLAFDRQGTVLGHGWKDGMVSSNLGFYTGVPDIDGGSDLKQHLILKDR